MVGRSEVKPRMCMVKKKNWPKDERMHSTIYVKSQPIDTQYKIHTHTRGSTYVAVHFYWLARSRARIVTVVASISKPT